MKLTVTKWFCVVICLHIDIFIQDGVCAAVCAVQASLLVCIVQHHGKNCLVFVPLNPDNGFL